MTSSRFWRRQGLFVGMLCCLLSFSAASLADAANEYRLSSGDKVSVYVFDETDLSGEFAISAAGTISYPFLGEIKVEGLTLVELDERITSGLKAGYLVSPEVNVTIKEYRPFYIHGEVQKSGGYAFQPGLTLRKAITLAGGLSERASERKIFVIREADPAKKSQPIGMDDPVYAGDTITVEQSFF